MHGAFLRLAIVGSACLAAVSACGPRRASPDTTVRAPADAGRIALYLEPIPREADGLSSEIAEVSAVSEDGTMWPLAVHLATLEGAGDRRQRLLAGGAVPAGRYRGVTIRAGSASQAGPRGRSALALPEASIAVESAFTVERGAVVLLSASLRVPRPTGGDVRFDPQFVIGAPPPGALAPAATAVAALPEVSTVALFHKSTGEVVQLLGTSDRPSGVAYDALRGRLYAACAGSGVVEAFDVVRGVREQSVPLQAGGRPTALALSQDGTTLVVAHLAAGMVTVLDAPTLTERHRVRVGREPVFVAFEPDGRRVFVVERGEFAVSVLDPERGVIVGTIAAESGPAALAFDRAGSRVVIVHRDSPNLLVADTRTLVVQRRVYVGPGSAAVAVDPRSDRVYLARRGIRGIEVFDPGSWLPIATIATGGDVSFLRVDRDEGTALAAVPSDGLVRILHWSSGRVAAQAELGAAPTWVDVAGAERAAR